jgi:hypothetical protein
MGSSSHHATDFRIRATKVGDGDLSPLQLLHRSADVVGPND